MKTYARLNMGTSDIRQAVCCLASWPVGDEAFVFTLAAIWCSIILSSSDFEKTRGATYRVMPDISTGFPGKLRGAGRGPPQTNGDMSKGDTGRSMEGSL